jgi:hypothetical protein
VAIGSEESFSQALRESYRAEFGLDPEILAVEPSDGAMVQVPPF